MRSNPITLRIKDETAGGDIIREILLSIENELTTVRDIIRARVDSEVERYNNHSDEYFNGLVAPSDAEKTLNGFRTKGRRLIDAEKQYYVALEAFDKNGYFVLIDNRQAESLEDEVLVGKDTIVSFVKLTPLVGG